jgi:antitoxin component of RelBE/YafQ-DinJ toxin-antitoxin module
MAQLYTEKEKYGVSVAARIDPNMAHQIADRAERMGLSFAKMVSLLISRGFDPQEPVRVENREEIERLEEELAEVTEALETLQTEDEANRNAIGLFIQTITSDVDEQRTHLNTFKTIRDELRDQQ